MASLLLPGCLPFEFLERAQEGQQGLALLGGQVDHLLPCRRRLAAVPEHRLEQTPRPPVVQKAGVAVDRLGEADPPERRRAPLASRRDTPGPIFGEPRAHVAPHPVVVARVYMQQPTPPPPPS